jgi:thermolysin/neutral peptidase B
MRPRLFRFATSASVLAAPALLVALAAAPLAACGNDDARVTASSGPLAPTGAEWVLENDERTGTAAIAFPLQTTTQVLDTNDPGGSAIRFLTSYPEVFGPSKASDLSVLATAVDEDGATHVKVEQKAQGRRLLGAVAVVTFDADRTVASVTGPLWPDQGSEAAVAPAVQQAPAEAAARAAYARSEGKPAATVTDHELALAATGSAPVLVHRFAVSGAAGANPRELWVDAKTGKVTFDAPLYHSETVTGSGAGVTGGKKTFPVEKTGATYRIQRVKQDNKAEVFVEDGITGKNAESASANGPWDPEAVDAYTNLLQIENWYRNRFLRVSYDDKGSPIRIVIHATNTCDNASWNGEFISFNDPCDKNAANTVQKYDPKTGSLTEDPSKTYHWLTFTDREVATHEYTHAITDRSCRLFYGTESGALNESMSDVFAALAEHSFTGAGDFKLGDGAIKEHLPLRNFADPADAVIGQPRHYSQLMANGAFDNGGVHINSGIPNHAFYLMVQGGTHKDSGVKVKTPLSWKQVEDLKWTALRFELKETSTFREFAITELLIAKRKNIPREPVACSWVAVGVLTPDETKKNFGIECPVSTEQPPSTVGCAGKADGVYCQSDISYGAVYCKNGARSYGLQCASSQICDVSKDGTATKHCKEFCKDKADDLYCINDPGKRNLSAYCQGGKRIVDFPTCGTGVNCDVNQDGVGDMTCK